MDPIGRGGSVPGAQFVDPKALARIGTHLTIRRLRQKLEQQLTLTERFMRIASHDLRNPLCLHLLLWDGEECCECGGLLLGGEALSELDLAQMSRVHVGCRGDATDREFAGYAQFAEPRAQGFRLGFCPVVGRGTARHGVACSTDKG